MGVRDNAINLFEEQRELTDDEMQAYKDMLHRKERMMKMPWEDDINWGNTATTNVKGEPTFEDCVIDIGNILRKLEGLEKRLSVAEKHIKILEVDRQIDVINPSWWDENEKGAEAE